MFHIITGEPGQHVWSDVVFASQNLKLFHIITGEPGQHVWSDVVFAMTGTDFAG